MVFRPCRPDDIPKVWSHFQRYTPGEASAYVGILCQPFLSYTYEYGGDVHGVGGATLLMPGVAEVWVGANPSMWYRPKEVVKGIRQAIQQMVAVNKLHRLQAMVDPENDTAKRFAEFMGFECEGMMRQYSVDRRDMLRYARIFS